MSGSTVFTITDDTHEILYRCCYCGRMRTADGDWQPTITNTPQPISHGICRTCFLVNHPEIPPPPNAR